MTASSRTEKKKKTPEYIWALCAIMCVCLSVFIWILHHFNCPHRALEAFTGFYITYMQLPYDVQFLSSVVYQMRYIHLICCHPPLPARKHKSRRRFHTCMHVLLSEGSANELSVDGGTSTLVFFFFQLRNRQLESILFQLH